MWFFGHPISFSFSSQVLSFCYPERSGETCGKCQLSDSLQEIASDKFDTTLPNDILFGCSLGTAFERYILIDYSLGNMKIPPSFVPMFSCFTLSSTAKRSGSVYLILIHNWTEDFFIERSTYVLCYVATNNRGTICCHDILVSVLHRMLYNLMHIVIVKFSTMLVENNKPRFISSNSFLHVSEARSKHQ